MLKIYIVTTGCSINRALGEILKQKISDIFDLVESPAYADIVILNLCAVKKPTEDRGIAIAKKLLDRGKKIIITGCLAESSTKRIIRQLPNANIVGIEHMLTSDLLHIINRISRGQKIIKTGMPSTIAYPSERILENRLIGIVPIAFGCINNCTYCIDRAIWGLIKSIPIDNIIREVRRLIRLGVKEIRLTAHDTAAYGIDKHYTLVNLLEKILEIDGHYRIRIGMASPNTFRKISDEILDLIRNEERIYNFVHIPLQSGSNRILELMNRPYTVEEYVDLFKKARKKLGQDSTIATDIITAFPTETEDDHQQTIKILTELKPDFTNISRYGDRPGRPATQLRPKIHSKIAKRRTKEIFEIVKKISYERNKRYLGQRLLTLFLDKKDRYTGRTNSNRLFYTEDPVELGTFKYVKIEYITWKALYGHVD